MRLLWKNIRKSKLVNRNRYIFCYNFQSIVNLKLKFRDYNEQDVGFHLTPWKSTTSARALGDENAMGTYRFNFSLQFFTKMWRWIGQYRWGGVWVTVCTHGNISTVWALHMQIKFINKPSLCQRFDSANKPMNERRRRESLPEVKDERRRRSDSVKPSQNFLALNSCKVHINCLE